MLKQVQHDDVAGSPRTVCVTLNSFQSLLAARDMVDYVS
ncbi:hypothetical protein JCM19233_5708 [Vibrio astriarenae]|nr:hypothetical protein JCM19233_5708 [Vibrio sp. C7]